MIQNRNIVCISTPPWESDYASTTVQLMRELAYHNNVLFVNNPFTAKDVWDGLKHKKKVPLKKVFGIKERLKTIQLKNGSRVQVLTPPMVISNQFLPQGGLYDTLQKWNGHMVLRSVKKYIKQLHMQKDLIALVAFNPALGLEVGRKLDEKLLLYLCYDDIDAAPHLSKHGPRHEKAFGKMADAFLFTSQGLYERKHQYANEGFIIKNAADYELFKNGLATQPPAQKTIGFIGSIDHRLDYALLEYLIQSLPDMQFRFVGRIVWQQGAEQLQKYTNVTLTGAMKVEALPAQLRQFSVGIIVFRLTETMRTIYPLKINEYLSAGLPVVTTNFSNLKEFENIVSIAKGYEDFKKLITEAIANDTPEKKKERQAFAKNNSWENRAEELSDIILQLEKNL